MAYDSTGLAPRGIWFDLWSGLPICPNHLGEAAPLPDSLHSCSVNHSISESWEITRLQRSG